SLLFFDCIPQLVVRADIDGLPHAGRRGPRRTHALELACSRPTSSLFPASCAIARRDVPASRPLFRTAARIAAIITQRFGTFVTFQRDMNDRVVKRPTMMPCALADGMRTFHLADLMQSSLDDLESGVVARRRSQIASV